MSEILAILFESVLFPVFLTLFLKARKGGWQLCLGVCAATAVLFCKICLTKEWGLYNLCALTADLVISSAFWRLCLRGTLVNFLLGFSLYYFGLYVSICLPIFLFSIANEDASRAFLPLGAPLRIWFVALAEGMHLLFLSLVLGFRERLVHQKRGPRMLCCSALPIVVLAVFLLSMDALVALRGQEATHGFQTGGLMAGMHFVVIAAFCLAIRVARKAQAAQKVERLHYMLELQRKSLERFALQERKLHRLRHELEHKLFTVRYLFEKGGWEEGHLILRQTVAQMCGEARDISVAQNLVDTVLVNIEGRHAREGIILEKEIRFLDERMMELVDLGILLGNLADNAMEAAAKSEKKRVKISVLEEFGCLFIRVANTYSEESSDVKLFSSRKEEGDKHGFGMPNIREIVGNYDGEFHVRHEDGWFFADVVIYGREGRR